MMVGPSCVAAVFSFPCSSAGMHTKGRQFLCFKHKVEKVINWLLNSCRNLQTAKFSRLFHAKKGHKNRSIRSGSALSIFEMSSHPSALADSLKEVYESLDPKFTQIGMELQSIHSEAAQLTEQTLKAARMIGGESDKGILADVGSLTKESLADLQTCRSDVSNSMDRVNSVAGHLGDLYAKCSVIEKIAMSLKVIILNIAVESSRSAESMDMFSDFVEDIKKLGEEIMEISEKIRDDCKKERKGQIFIHKEISGGLSQLSDLAADAEETVQSAVLEIEHLIGLSVKALEDASAHSKEISCQVEKIVIAIQFHDITRQQVEHVIEFLRDVESLCVGETSGAELKTDKNDVLNRAHSILRLQASQLKETRSEIDAAYRQIMSAFEVIGSEVGRLVADASGFGQNKADADPPATAPPASRCEALRAGRHERADVTEDPFAVLKSALLRLNPLLGQGRDLRNRIQQRAVQASETSSRLSHYVDQVGGISNGLHLKALNAIVKTAHLNGRGRTLEVLAQEVNRLSDQSSEFVPNVVDLLDTITALARKLVGESSEVAGGAQAAGGGEAKTSIDAGIQDISSVYDLFREDSLAALERSRTLQTAISQTRSGLCFLPELTNQLAAHTDELEKMLQLLSPWVDEKIAEEKINELIQRYTMDRERAVHEQVFEGTDKFKAEEHYVENSYELITETGPEKDEDKDDLGDNVELF